MITLNLDSNPAVASSDNCSEHWSASVAVSSKRPSFSSWSLSWISWFFKNTVWKIFLSVGNGISSGSLSPWNISSTDFFVLTISAPVLRLRRRVTCETISSVLVRWSWSSPFSFISFSCASLVWFSTSVTNPRSCSCRVWIRFLTVSCTCSLIIWEWISRRWLCSSRSRTSFAIVSDNFWASSSLDVILFLKEVKTFSSGSTSCLQCSKAKQFLQTGTWQTLQ